MIPLWLWLAYTISASITGIYLYRLGAEIGYDQGYTQAMIDFHNDRYFGEDYHDSVSTFDRFETRHREQNITDHIYGSSTGYI